jgi:hypothetical protein
MPHLVPIEIKILLTRGVIVIALFFLKKNYFKLF